MKKFKAIITLLTVTIVASLSTISASACTGVCTGIKGDVNGDGQVKSNDLLMMKKYVLDQTLTQDFCLCNADFNNDNKVNQADVDALKQYLLGLS